MTFMSGLGAAADKRHILTIALEDYFQVHAFHKLIPRASGIALRRDSSATRARALELLDRFDMRATFFVPGWIADSIRTSSVAVAERGHEIASQGYYHRSIRQMTPAEFRDDSAPSATALEQAGGTRILGYRVATSGSPQRSLGTGIVWRRRAIPTTLASPALRRFAREPWRRFQHRLQFGDRQLWEFPYRPRSSWGGISPSGAGTTTPVPPSPHEARRRALAPDVLGAIRDVLPHWEWTPTSRRSRLRRYWLESRHYETSARCRGLEDYFTNYRFTSIADYLGLDVRGSERQPASTPSRFEFLRKRRRYRARRIG